MCQPIPGCWRGRLPSLNGAGMDHHESEASGPTRFALVSRDGVLVARADRHLPMLTDREVRDTLERLRHEPPFAELPA